jgi:putative Mn2+ efflux pump MntP
VLRVLTIAGLILPLAIDTFVLGTALGAAGIARTERLRTSLILTVFEAGMPVIGFLAGAGLGLAVGGWANYAAAGVLAGVGLLMLRSRDDDEEQKVRLLESARGWGVVALGIGISVDELAIGFGVGLLRLPFLLLIVLIAAQAFAAAQLGMRLGSLFSKNARNTAARVAGLLLMVTAALLVVERIIGI